MSGAFRIRHATERDQLAIAMLVHSELGTRPPDRVILNRCPIAS